MAPYIKGATMLAHNAGFDRSVLHETARFHGITDMPRNKWVCSLQASRKAWPHLQRHKLNLVCHHLDIPLDHHNAESDAMASWLVWKAAHSDKGRDTA
jgi:DNA polymerase-3 subunit epsilon